MPLPTISDAAGSSATGTGGVSWGITRRAGQPTYAVIMTDASDFFQAFTHDCDIDGVEMTPIMRWNSGDGHEGGAYVFVMPAPLATDDHTLTFASSDTGDWSGVSFNVAGGPLGGRAALIHGYYSDAASMTRKAYAWDPAGLLVAVLFDSLGASVSLSTTGGTEFFSGNGLRAVSVPSNDGEIAFASTAPGRNMVISLLIPPASQAVEGGDPHLWFTGQVSLSALDPGDSATVGLPYGASDTSAGRSGNIIPLPGTVRSIGVAVSEALDVDAEVTAELMIGAVGTGTTGVGSSQAIPTGITVTIPPGETSASLDGVDFPFNRYERLAMRFTDTGSVALPLNLFATASFLVESGAGRDQAYGGGSMAFGGAEDVAVKRAPLHPMHDTPWSNPFADSEKALIGIHCTIAELIVNYQTDVSVDPDHEYYLDLDGEEQAETLCALVTDSIGPALARWRGTLTAAPGQFLSVVSYSRTGSALLRQAATIRVRPTTRGEMILSGHSANTGTVDFVAAPNASRTEHSTTTADEAAYSLLIPPLTAIGGLFHARGMRGALEAAGPGTDKALLIKLRKELADTDVALEFLDAETTDVAGGLASYASGERLSVYHDAVNAPSLARQWWTIPGFLQPPEPVIGPHIWILFPRLIVGDA